MLGTGVVVAAVSFTMLTAAANTSDLRVTGTVERHFTAAYDILVRPSDSFTPLERQRDLVQQNYLSGIFGGITLQQYREIRSIPGVDVAAPIANIGYVIPWQQIPITINRFLSDDATQMYRLSLSWVANGGASVYPGSTEYIYFTRSHRFVRTGNGTVGEVLPGGRTIPACIAYGLSNTPGLGSPFRLRSQSGLYCFSARTPGLQYPVLDVGPLPAGQVGTYAFVSFPVLLAAIDPVQEARLVGLDGAVVEGRMLEPREGPEVEKQPPGVKFRVVPFLASTRTYLSEHLRVSVQQLELLPADALYRGLTSETDAYRFVRRLPGRDVGSLDVPLGPIYEGYLDSLSPDIKRLHTNYESFWTTSPIEYDTSRTNILTPITTRNAPLKTFSGGYGEGWAPQENRDVQFRRLTQHRGGNSFANGVYLTPEFRIVGRYDPELLPGFSRLSEVPLETYYPPSIQPADAASREALAGQALLPTMNLGGYVSQPPLMLTTLQGLRAFTNPDYFQGASPSAPISVIRIRVAGVTGADELSQERIKNVAQAIHNRTGLAVDITAGSSPRQLLVQLPGGKYGQPPLLVREGWVEKGVAVRFLQALDRKSLALFALILVICGFFLANGALASVRSRRSEIGTLACLGWSPGRIFRAVLGEVALIGLIAGAVGTLIAAVLVPLASLDMTWFRTLLVAPLAVVLATLAGIVPAWRAARSNPLDAIRPSVSEHGSGHSVHRIVRMGLSNLRRVPSRTLLAATGLFIGVAALTLLLAINRAFQGVLVGTLLGNAVSIEVRGVDFLTVALTIALGGLSVADVLFLNLRERAPELVTLRTVGWRDSHLRRLVLSEGVAIGAIGSFVGLGVGTAVASVIRGIPVSSVALSGAISGAAGIAVAGLASLVPLVTIGRMTPPAVLAEE